jgi:hypothetical protein
MLALIAGFRFEILVANLIIVHSFFLNLQLQYLAVLMLDL